MPHHFCCRDVWAGPKANPNDKWVVAAFVAGYILNLYWYDSRTAACGHVLQIADRQGAESPCFSRFRAIAKAAQRALKRAKEA